MAQKSPTTNYGNGTMHGMRMSVLERFTSRVISWMNWLDPERRNMYKDCGWPMYGQLEQGADAVTAFYKPMYDREAIAVRVVNICSSESWVDNPSVYETEDVDPDNKTPFEEAWETLVKEFDLFSWMQRVDEISGIGRFGILVLGVGVDGKLQDPIQNVDDYGKPKGPAKPSKLLYVRAFGEDRVSIQDTDWEDRNDNPRYGQPKYYTVKMGDSETKLFTDVRVHWTRVIHVADNCKDSTVYGVPRMQQVFHRLCDIRKILGGSAEAVWKSGFPYLIAEASDEAVAAGAEFDAESLKEQFSAMMEGLQRYMALQNATAKAIGGTVADTSNQLMDQITEICILIGVPLRKFIGSEEGKQAADQDAKSWNNRLNARRVSHCTMVILRPTVWRLIAAGCLPAPAAKDYITDWPDNNAPTPKEKGEVSKLIAQVLAIYVREELFTVMSFPMFLTMVVGWTMEEAEEAAESVKDVDDETPARLGMTGDDEEDDNGNGKQGPDNGNNGDGENAD